MNKKVYRAASARISGRSAIAVLLAGLMLLAAIPKTWAQQGSYPDRSIRLVVPFPPGGLTDILARTLAERLREPLGQSIVVDNRPGAGGLIGSEQVTSAVPDGYTLLLTSLNNHVMLPLIQKTKFEPERDLESVGLAIRGNVVLLTSNNTPAKSLSEFVAYAKGRPGKLNYSSSGNGSFGQFSAEVFNSMAGINVLHVPYKGAAPSVTALMSNEVQFLIVAYSAVQGYVEAGQIRALAQDGTKRDSLMPNVPTLAEAGYPSFQPTFWLGVSAPKQTPRPVVQKLNQALNDVLNSSYFKEKSKASAWTPLPGNPAALDQIVAHDLKQYGDVVKRLNISAN